MARPSPVTIGEDANIFWDTAEPLVSSSSSSTAGRSISSSLSFREKLYYGLLSPTSTELTDRGGVLNEEEYQDKVAAIEDCLRGIDMESISVPAGDSSSSKNSSSKSSSPTSTNEKQTTKKKNKKNKKKKDQIDLWQLRELALQPGGLLEPNLRKRAWPLLTAAVAFPQQPTATPPSPTTSTTTTALSPADLAALRRQVPRTVWNVTEHFAQQQKQQSHSSNSSIWSGTASTATTGRRRHRWRKAGKLEQTIVSNAVASCLRRRPPPPARRESVRFEDDDDHSYHYFSGLHDLAALLMINLESPSLSSLVLQKLAEYHLRDAMRKERTVMETAVELTFFPVLERVDPVLHQHLVVQTGSNSAVPDFFVRWVSNWFATDTVDLAAASRLVDAFLVSHAAMPLYCAVALLTCHRQRLLEECGNWKDVCAVLQTLPLFAAGAHDSNNNNNNSLDVDDDLTVESQGSHIVSNSSSLEQVEQIIATGLRYMKRIPPSLLIAVARKSNDNQALVDRIPSIAMFDTSGTPGWCLADTSPTEYAILRRAKKIRQGRLTKEKEAGASPASRPTAALFSYPLAMAAWGRGGSPRKRPHSSAGGFASKLLCLLMIVAILLDPSSHCQPPPSSQSQLPSLLPSTVAPSKPIRGINWIAILLDPSSHCQPPPSQSQLPSLLPSAVAPTKPIRGINWKAHGLFRHRAFVPKITNPYPTKEVAVYDESEAMRTVALPLAGNNSRIAPGWKVFVADAPRKIASIAHRYLVAPATRKVNPFPRDKISGKSFPRMI